MKTMSKKLASIVLALCLCFSLVGTALAATVTYNEPDAGDGSITITNAKNGETYELYKMLDVTYDSTNESYAYTVASGWEAFFSSGAASEYFDVDTNGYVTLKTVENPETGNSEPALTSGSSEMAALAKAALSYAEENEIEAMISCEADEDGATFNNLPMGWYLVGTTLGSLCSIDTLTGEVQIEEKNPTPTPEKEQYDPTTDEDWNDDDTVNVGDTVQYEVFLKDVANAKNLCMHDALSEGLTFDTSSVKVYYAVVTEEDLEDLYHAEINWIEVDSSEYTWTENDNCNDDCTFELSFGDSFLDGIDSMTVIRVTYEAEVNEYATDVDHFYDVETNEVHLTYGASQFSTTISTESDDVGFELKKINEDEAQLEGAEFTLYYDEALENSVNFLYTAATESNKAIYEATTDLTMEGVTTTITAGDVEILGLAEGTYYLVETSAPDGYNKLTSPVAITIVLEYDEVTGEIVGETITVGTGASVIGSEVDIINYTGEILPSTGGMGTTIFYIIGGVLVAGAVVVLITRRRMSSNEG